MFTYFTAIQVRQTPRAFHHGMSTCMYRVPTQEYNRGTFPEHSSTAKLLAIAPTSAWLPNPYVLVSPRYNSTKS